MNPHRTPYQGVVNIIRFNWPFYVLAIVGMGGLLVTVVYAPHWLVLWVWAGLVAVLVSTLVSLGVSHYIYDRSGLYALDWLAWLPAERGMRMANINAGFDEMSAFLAERYPQATLDIFDFYDPTRHTEPSIERARRAYPAYPGTQVIDTDRIPLAAASADVLLLLLAAHEIRDDTERVRFFRDLARTLRPGGHIVVMEHLRDLPNFLAYTIGFLHFHSRRTWLRTFRAAGLRVVREQKQTPFIAVFFLQPDGTES